MSRHQVASTNGICNDCSEFRPCRCGVFCPSCKGDLVLNEPGTEAFCARCDETLKLRRSAS